MMGRIDTKRGPCPGCSGSGVDPKNRKQKCLQCYGQKHVQWCMTCDTPIPCTGTNPNVMDQSRCDKS